MLVSILKRGCYIGLCAAALGASLTAQGDSVAVVAVRFGRDLYNIPTNYITSVFPATTPNGESSFTMEALLPNLAPRSPENIRKFVWTDARGQVHGGFDDILLAAITFDSHLNMRNKDEVIAGAIDSLGLTPEQFVPFAPGVRLYRNPLKSGQEYYVADPRAGGARFWSCDAAGTAPRLGCQLVEAWSSTVYADINFDKRYVGQIEDIDRQLRMLFASFKSKPQPPRH